MRYLVLAIIFIVVLTGFSSCEKIIEVDLNASESKYVIEGVVTNQPGTARVIISTTKNMGDDNDFPGVSGATVEISDNMGNTTVLMETSVGIYEAPALTGVSGNVYTLRVDINGRVFSATSVLPQPVNMDTIYLTNDNLFNSSRRLVNVEYDDPPGTGNNYRFVQYVNGLKEKNIFIRNDAFTDGNRSLIKLRYLHSDEDNIKSGDHIRIDMLCIDSNVYKYWYSLEQGATGSSDAAAPANPVSNISGGAMGYFSAHTLQTKTMIAP